MKTAIDGVLATWGFTVDPSPDSILPLVFDESFVQQWEQDLALLSRAVTRLVKQGTLGAGPEAFGFTHGAEKIRANHSPFIGRPDFIFSLGQPKLIELNVDSSLGGLLEVSELAAIYVQAADAPKGLRFRSPMDALAGFLRKSRTDLDTGVLLLSSRSFSSYYQDVCLRMANTLGAALKTTCDIGYVDELTLGEFVTFKGADIGLVLRIDAVLGDSPEQVALAKFLISAAATKTVVVSDSMFLDVEHKGVLAVLRDLVSHQAALLRADEIDVISRLIPLTWILGCNSPAGQSGWEQELLDRKNDLVLKRMYSFGGNHTLVGRYLSPQEWREAMDKALRAPTLWIAQEYIEPDRLLVFGGRKLLQPGQAGVRCVVSPFVFDDAIGGFLCRTQLDEKSAVLGLASGASMGFSMVAEHSKGQ